MDEVIEADKEILELEAAELRDHEISVRVNIKRLPCVSHKIHLVCLKTTKSKVNSLFVRYGKPLPFK